MPIFVSADSATHRKAKRRSTMVVLELLIMGASLLGILATGMVIDHFVMSHRRSTPK